MQVVTGRHCIHIVLENLRLQDILPSGWQKSHVNKEEHTLFEREWNHWPKLFLPHCPDELFRPLPYGIHIHQHSLQQQATFWFTTRAWLLDLPAPNLFQVWPPLVVSLNVQPPEMQYKARSQAGLKNWRGQTLLQTQRQPRAVMQSQIAMCPASIQLLPLASIVL